MSATVPGIHHVTAITRDVQTNVDFYVGVLGLRFIKKTVNFDVPDTYHIYFGDRLGTPGTALTFFGWPHLPAGGAGAGQVTSIALAVPEPSLDFWRQRLTRLQLGVEVERHFGADVVAVGDPDGIRLELVGQTDDGRWEPWPDSPVAEANQIRGLHSVGLCVSSSGPTYSFLTETMGFQHLETEPGRVRFRTGEGGPGALLDLFVQPEAQAGQEMAGTVHHVAWQALTDDEEVEWRERLIFAGRDVTPVIDRKYFHSIYFREPGGVLFEIATDGPGFTVDEPAEALGTGLQLPAEAEETRGDLSHNLPPIVVPSFSRSQ
jgi:glyoxalase family protein